MNSTNSTDIVLQTMYEEDNKYLTEAIDEFIKAGLPCSVKSHDPGPQQSVVWLTVSALTIWVGKRYFGAFLDEAGKDHYQSLKAAMCKLYTKTLAHDAPISRNMDKVVDNSPVRDEYFSSNLSFVYAAPEGWTAKLMFPLNVSEKDYDDANKYFSQLIREHILSPQESILNSELENTAEDKIAQFPEGFPLTAADMRPNIRLLLFWNPEDKKFYVPSPDLTGMHGKLIVNQLGSVDLIELNYPRYA